MRIGLDLAQQRMEFSEIVRRARLAEDLGFDGVWGFDHFQPMYGSGPGNCFEAMTTLAALGGLTERVRLGVLVTGLTYRHPSVLALQAITVDHASGGRLELGVGAGWYDKEHHELGIAFPDVGERVGRFEEGVRNLIALQEADDVTVGGRWFPLQGATLRPRPVQQPHIPVWIGASGPRMLRVAAQYADAWHSFGDLERLTALSGALDRVAEAAGRDPAVIARATNLDLEAGPDAALAAAEGLAAAGFGYVVAGWPAGGDAVVEDFARRALGPIGALASG